MKKPAFVLSAFFFAGALLLPAAAQHESHAKAPEDNSAQADAANKQAKTSKKKTAKMKTTKKPAVREPQSEYKFMAVDTPAAYKFDKLANPIVTAKPKPRVSAKKGKTGKNPAARDAGKTTGQSAPKLKKLPGFNEEAPANNSENNSNNPENNPEEGQ